MICTHGFVPDNFGMGVIVLVLKDRLDICSANNYRPVTLSPVISKIFEYCVLHKYKHLFISVSKRTLAFHTHCLSCHKL